MYCIKIIALVLSQKAVLAISLLIEIQYCVFIETGFV